MVILDRLLLIYRMARTFHQERKFLPASLCVLIGAYVEERFYLCIGDYAENIRPLTSLTKNCNAVVAGLGEN